MNYFRVEYREFYHGTSLFNGVEIYTSNYWLPSDDLWGIWMTDSLSVAREFPGSVGVIVVLDVHPTVPMIKNMDKPSSYYVVPITNPKPNRYCRIPGIRPVAVLSPKGRRVL